MSSNNSVFICSRVFCCFPSKIKARKTGVYTAGILFALGWWIFLDGLITLSVLPDRQVAPGIEDWAPGICATLGMILVNLIDKEALSDGGSYYDDGYMWKVRGLLFLGFTFMAGGISSSIAIMIIKYLMNDWLDFTNKYLGIADTIQSALIMLSTTILWLSQQSRDDRLEIY
ncbi:vacuolar protein sorting protein 68 [Pilobolus umbonatus]|nr:vacuolar protein sorting protein 68 [Pilobolus umbonatus]